MPVSINNPANVIINNGARVIAANPIPPIVQDGLVLNLDAGNVFSYPTVGNTWYDLTSNLEIGTLYGGALFNSSSGSYISFDGTDEYCEAITKANSPLNVGANGTVTIEALVKIKGVSGNGIIFNYGAGSLFALFGSYSLFVNQSVSQFQFSSGAGGGGGTLTPAYTYNQWRYVVLIFKTGGAGSIYVDGTFVANNTRNTESRTRNIFYVGFYQTPSYLNGDVAFIRVYNRELSATEVSQNFNAFHWRFGI